MSLNLRIALGCTEAIIDDDGGLKRFYQVADILSSYFNIKFTRKEDDFDTINWEFSFRGYQLTLHYNIYTGISMYPAKAKDADVAENNAVVELAGSLESKFLSQEAHRHTA